MRWLICLLLLLSGAAPVSPAWAQPAGQRFVSIAFHDVADRVDELDVDAVTTRSLAQFFDWLKGSGWTAVSLDDIAAAARGLRPLPDKAILVTFDDGYRSLYTRVFPLLQIYRFPIVAALTGSWMEGRPDGTVLYGDRVVPRSHFLSWSEARELQASGLVEFASHSYDLHRGVLANPQGNMVPAAITWRYDPATRRYETDQQYRNRIRADLQRSRQQIATQLGRPPRALVWPFGRFSGPALAEAKAVGFTFALTLEPEPAYTSDLFAIHRYFPSLNPSLGDLARNLRFDPDYPATRRIACLTLDALAAAGPGPPQDAVLGAMIERLRSLGANIAVVDAHAGPLAPGAPLGEVYFPNAQRPVRADLLSRATWQLRTRGGADVFLRLPLDAAAAAVGDAGVPALFADMARYTAADGLAMDATVAGQRIVPDIPGNIRARRATLDSASLDPQARRALLAYRGAAAIDPRLRLMLASAPVAGPPDWTDMALLGPNADAAAVAALARRLRSEGWLRPDVAGRVALGLPADPARQVDAIRQAQRQAASAFALCPQPLSLPPSAALAAAFSAATYPYRP
jgi:peptidoglycan/xylan/chitin deacetylase (PgdA/CDA1 family)